MSTPRLQLLLGVLIVIVAGMGLILLVHKTRSPDTVGMTYIRGGSFLPGKYGGIASPNEKQRHIVRVGSFFIDTTPVTVAAFEQYADRNQLVTNAELHGGGMQPNLALQSYIQQTQEWHFSTSTNFREPRGSGSNASPDHPVTLVTYDEAERYCRSLDKRLPTEDEFEYVARNEGKTAAQYPWGTNSVTDEQGRPLANVWQALVSSKDTPADGYVYTAPVGILGKNLLGVSDLAGNVWEWTSTDYLPARGDVDHGGMNQTMQHGDTLPVTVEMSELEAVKKLPFRISTGEKVLKGGSFLCNQNSCNGFSVFARMHLPPESALWHVGFRCVAEP